MKIKNGWNKFFARPLTVEKLKNRAARFVNRNKTFHCQPKKYTGRNQ
jgi:hypothetical protein